MSYKPGQLVELNPFEAGRRGSNKIMLVIDKFTRLKREGDYYRLMDGDQLTICHESQIQKIRKDESEN